MPTPPPPSDYIYATVHKALKIEIAKMAYSNIYFMWLCNCFRANPHLKETGGFQILLSKAKKVVCHGSCSTEQLCCFGTGRIYIRPLQKSILLTRSVHVKQEFQACLSCGESFGISEMRRHLETCEVVGRPSFEIHRLMATLC